MMPSTARIWLTHSVAFCVGLLVAYGAVAGMSFLLIPDDADWVAALGRVLMFLFVGAAIGVLGYGAVITQGLHVRFGALGWCAATGLGLASVAAWISATAFAGLTPPVAAMCVGAALYGIGGIVCVWAVRRRQA